MSNDELANLRKLVRARRSAVTAKENRIKRRTGVDIRGTAEDPRRPVNVVTKYNRPQLNAYLKELNNFMSRSVGFVGSAHGHMPKNDWLAYKKLENAYNRLGSKRFEEIADLFVPIAGMTLRQREETMNPDKVRGQGEIVVNPFAPIRREAHEIKDVNALAKLKADLAKRMTPEYGPAAIAAGREQMNHMLTVLGNHELSDIAANMSDFQFETMWFNTKFAKQLSSIYFIMKSKSTGGDERWYDSVVGDYSNDIREILTWAASLNGEPQTTTRRGKSTITQGKNGGIVITIPAKFKKPTNDSK